MPYLGKTPASVALATSDLADNIVTEAKMADDAISIVELKAGTDGEVISWDASGNPVAIGAGTSGHFLKSQGAGSQPVFAAFDGAYDLQGAKLTLDANANTSITADTDDQIDIEIAGADDFQFTANTFTIPSGSTVAIAAGGAITNAGSMAPDISSTGKAMVLGF